MKKRGHQACPKSARRPNSLALLHIIKDFWDKPGSRVRKALFHDLGSQDLPTPLLMLVDEKKAAISASQQARNE